MSRAVLEVVRGPGRGQRIEFSDQVEIGRGVEGPGRIEGEQGSVAERQMIVRLTHLGLEVEGLDELARTHVGPSGGAAVGKGKTHPGGFLLDPTSFLRKGGRIELRPQGVYLGSRGDNSTAIEVVELEIDWMNRLSPDDLLEAVRFRPAFALRAQPGFLHADGDRVTLHGRRGVFLEGPLGGVRAICPPWRSRLIRLASGGARCTVLLGTGSVGGLPGAGTDEMGYVDPVMAGLNVVMTGLVTIERWGRRREWKGVLRGKRSAAEVAAEDREHETAEKKSRYGRVQ